MARHTIQVPIIKSSNTAFTTLVYADEWDDDYLTVPAVSNKLYAARKYPAGGLAQYGFGVAWGENAIPKNKNIVSAKLYLYTTHRHSRTIYYRYIDFNEGSSIPYYTPADGGKSGGVSNGWDYIDIGIPKGNSVVVYGALEVIVNSTPEWNWRYAEYWELYAHRNSNYKPYLEIIYDDIPPGAPTSLYPAGITLSSRDVIRFAWLHNSEEGLLQKAFQLQYSTNGGSTWTTVNQNTQNQYYDMPASTLPTTGTVTWRVRTTDTNDVTSEYSTETFTLGAVPQKAPVALSPISQYVEENKPIRFEWSFLGGSSGETQRRFQLQHSNNGGVTWVTVDQTTGNQYYDMPANTLPSGNITWRVRTYNNWNEVSPYSENKSFTVIGAPPIPLITAVSNSARPTVTWQSTDQHLYELQIIKNNEVMYDTGTIPSTADRNFNLPIYLDDGSYIAKLRIANEYNLYSAWAEKSFTIATVKPTKPLMAIYSGQYGVTIKTEITGLKTLVYRDNTIIGQMIEGHFVDYSGRNKTEYQYFIRSIDASDNFADSDIKLAKCKFRGNTLALASNPGDFIKLRLGYNDRPKKSNQFGVVGSLQYYDGRKYPVVEYSDFNSKSKTLTFFVKAIGEVAKIEKMIEARQTFLYRNNTGKNIYGAIFSITYDENIFGYEIGLTIEKTDYKGVGHD